MTEKQKKECPSTALKKFALTHFQRHTLFTNEILCSPPKFSSVKDNNLLFSANTLFLFSKYLHRNGGVRENFFAIRSYLNIIFFEGFFLGTRFPLATML